MVSVSTFVSFSVLAPIQLIIFARVRFPHQDYEFHEISQIIAFVVIVVVTATLF